MIARLAGRVAELGPDHAVIDVGGVGYLVSCSARTLSRLSAVGEAAQLLVETRLREDALTLYGFADAEERRAFRTLTTVQGVGARLALAILSALTPPELVRAIAAGDKAPLTRADGIGGKLAARIVNELKDKLAPEAANGPIIVQVGGSAIEADAISALVHLGYAPAEASGAVASARRAQGERATLATLVPAALKALAA